MDERVIAYKEFICALMEFDELASEDELLYRTILNINLLTRVIENRLCELVPEYKAELDNLDN